MMQIDAVTWLSSGGDASPSKEGARRLTAIRHAQAILAADVVGVARMIEAYTSQSDKHAEAMRLAISGAGVDLGIESVTALAESIRAYLAEPLPSSGSDTAPPLLAAEFAA